MLQQSFIFKAVCNTQMHKLVENVVVMMYLKLLLIFLYIISCLIYFMNFLLDWQFLMVKYDFKKGLKSSTIYCKVSHI